MQHVLAAVIQQSKYPIFHDGILLSDSVFHGRVLLPYSYQYLTTKTSAQGDILKPQVSFISSTHI